MSEYITISKKIFITKRSELEGRFDPNFAEPERLLFYKRLKENTIIIRFKDIIKEGYYGILPPGDSYNDNLPIKFIRATELKEDLKIDFENVNYVEKKYYTRRASIKKNDILLAVKGATIASNKCVAIVTEDIGNSIVNGSIFRMQVNENALPLYVAYILNSDLLKRQMKYNLVANNAVDYLDKALIQNLLLPLPSVVVQQQIISIYQNAYAQKQQRETQAKQLLESIDTFLLSELGIELKQQKYSAKDRIFISSFKEIVGSRIDPKLYDNATKEIKNAISNAVYPKVALKELIIQSAAGDWGIEDTDTEIEGYTKCLVIRATEFDNKGNLTLNNSRVKYRLIKNEKLKSIDIKTSDLLIEKSGGSPDQPVGRVAIITQEYLENNQLGYSNFIHKIRLDESKVLPGYAFYFLKAVHNMKLTDAMQSQTNGIRNLIMSNYFNQSIVLPSIKKQDEIIKHIKVIQQQILQLQTEASSILENANAEVEKMILG